MQEVTSGCPTLPLHLWCAREMHYLVIGNSNLHMMKYAGWLWSLISEHASASFYDVFKCMLPDWILKTMFWSQCNRVCHTNSLSVSVLVRMAFDENHNYYITILKQITRGWLLDTPTQAFPSPCVSTTQSRNLGWCLSNTRHILVESWQHMATCLSSNVLVVMGSDPPWFQLCWGVKMARFLPGSSWTWDE